MAHIFSRATQSTLDCVRLSDCTNASDEYPLEGNVARRERRGFLFLAMVKNQQKKKQEPGARKKMLIQFLVSLSAVYFTLAGAEHDFSEWSEQRKKHIAEEEKKEKKLKEIIHRRHAQNVVLR